MDLFYNVEQISRLLNIHPKTIQRYIREGRLRATKIGKSWRVSGHDLSVFTEGTNMTVDNKQSNIPAERAKASSVIDIDVVSRDEAIHIINTLTAVMNVKPSECGQCSMQAQFLEPDYKVRVMVWGNVKSMSVILNTIEVLVGRYEEETR